MQTKNAKIAPSGRFRIGNQRALFAAALVTASGCTVGPNYKAPDLKSKTTFTETAPAPTTQPASAVSTAAPPLTEWWSTFRDTEMQSLVARAVKGNHNLEQAASRVREARAQRGITGTSLLPDLNGDGGYQRAHGSKGVTIPLGAFGGSSGSTGKSTAGAISPVVSKSGSNSSSKGRLIAPAAVNTPAPSINEAAHPGGPQSPFGSGGFPGVNTDLYEAGFDSTWEIDVFGGQRRAVEASIDDIQAAQEDQRSVYVSLIAEVARTYIELRGYQRQLYIAKQNLDSQQRTLNLTKSRAEAGLVTDLDVARQATQVSTTAAAIPGLDAQIRISIHSLGLLLGEDPNSLTAELMRDGQIPPVPPEIPIGLPSELLRRRPDVRRAERQLAAATARIGEAQADLLPKFSITAALGFDASRIKPLFNWDSRYWALSPGVSWPIFDAGRIRFNITVQNERQAQALSNYQQTILQAMKDVEDSLASYSTEQLRRESLANAVITAKQAVALANQQYTQGIIDQLPVLDAERAQFAAEDSLAQSDRNISTNLVSLYKALGGGWEIALPAPQPE